MSTVVRMNDRDAVDAIIGQWAAVRPDLDTRAMEVFGRTSRVFSAMTTIARAAGASIVMRDEVAP